MNSRATRKFWRCFHRLPDDIQMLTTKQYLLWLQNPLHPSVQFKKTSLYWSAKVTEDYRALGIMEGDTVIWFWVGTHDEYERLLRGK
jgi:hypothetical protein